MGDTGGTHEGREGTSRPLSGRALAVLEETRQLADSTGLIFPSAIGRTLSDSALSKLLKESEIEALAHGFRSSFRD